mmetsp:Transcript_22742/g.70657  ORF Transcript_22742/g.70657 Transcript_22742/m.70657 type:complete len:515 (+) Transcript_22742:344-1888(+)
MTTQVLDSVVDVGRHVKRRAATSTFTVGDGQGWPTGPMSLEEKPVLLVLGSGWGSHSLLKVIDVDAFDVVCVSPNNHFLFTPMLPSTAVGTVEFRSLLEPIRMANEFVTYCEATCDGIDLTRKVASCTSKVTDSTGYQPTFDIRYDLLVVAVGEMPASFGVPGVMDNCFFMKEIADSVALRKRVQEVFELAALPGTSVEEARDILHFVVVGGGPTGVEFAGTLADFLKEDLRRKYGPKIMRLVRLTLLQSGQSILTQFDSRLAERATENFRRTGVEVKTGVRVVEVTSEEVVLGSGERIRYGVCVWSAGNAPRPLVQGLAAQIEEQAPFIGRDGKAGKLVVDDFLRVVGAEDVLALGDCAKVLSAPLPATAQVAGQQGAYAAHVINRQYVLGVGGANCYPPTKTIPKGSVSIADLVFGTVEVLEPEGRGKPKMSQVTLKKPFEFLSLGILAAIGDDKAIAEVEVFGKKMPLWGSPAFLLWRSVYITKQVSFRNRVLILFDWLKTRVFGRDLSQF